MALTDRINLYTYRAGYLNYRWAIFFIFVGFSISVVGFMYFESYSFKEALYMTVITLSTVGYGELRPLSESGRLFATLLIIFNFIVFAYTISSFTALVIEGDLFKNLHLKTIERHIKKMKNHIILCGYGRYGREVADHLINHKIPFIIIERDKKKIESIQRSPEKLLYIDSDVTNDEALVRAQIEKAQALITTLSDDTDNLFTVLSARQLNPKIHIISSSHDLRTERKLKMAGADHVIQPDRLGGLYMATLVSKPGTVEFFSFISNDFETDIGVEELAYDEVPKACKDLSIRDLKIRSLTGANIIGFKHKNGMFTVNPDPDVKLSEGTSFIVLANQAQFKAVRNLMKSQG